MDIRHPRRILAIGLPDSGVLDVIRSLTGSIPTLNENGSTAGVSHEWDAHTAYYRAKVPIWLDEYDDAEAWKVEFLRPEAREVVAAVGAWVCCFRPADATAGASDEAARVMRAVTEVCEEQLGPGADAVRLAVAVPRAGTAASNTSADAAVRLREACEDAALLYGFEYVECGASGANEFGEKQGFERVKEALEANEWDGGGDMDAGLLEDYDDDGPGVGLELDEAEMTAELFGVKSALVDADEEDAGASDEVSPPEEEKHQVESLDQLMRKLLAVKEQSADLPEPQRKRLAARAVRDILNN